MIIFDKPFALKSKQTAREFFFRIVKSNGSVHFVYQYQGMRHRRIGTIVENIFTPRFNPDLACIAFNWYWQHRDNLPDSVEVQDASVEMKRHPKKLMDKAQLCKVEFTDKLNELRVTSPSGKEYLVTSLANGGFVCVCEWADWRNTVKEP